MRPPMRPWTGMPNLQNYRPKGKTMAWGGGGSIPCAATRGGTRASVSTKTCPPEMQQASGSVRDSCTRMDAVGTGLNGLE